MSMSPSFSPVVLEPSAITPEWLTAALRSSGHDVNVVACWTEAVGTGQMAHNERIFLEYAGDPDGLAPTLVAKMPSPSAESRAAGGSGAYRAETRFYLEVADQLNCVTPACHYGAISEDQTTFTLLLEDLAPKRQGDQIAGASADEIEAAVRNLAGLHAPMRNAALLDQIDWLVGGVGDQLATYIEMATPAFIERYRSRLSDEDAAVLAAFAANVGNWIARRPAARTLVHGDYRLDNLMFETTPNGVAVAAVDWQTLSVACGGQDLAYLLGNSSSPDQRRAHEAPMLEVYREAMAALGVPLSAAEILDEYVYGTFQGPAITILGALAVGQTDRGDDMFMAMASRSCAQIRDLEALDRIR
jgi:hypothetical protein